MLTYLSLSSPSLLPIPILNILPNPLRGRKKVPRHENYAYPFNYPRTKNVVARKLSQREGSDNHLSTCLWWGIRKGEKIMGFTGQDIGHPRPSEGVTLSVGKDLSRSLIASALARKPQNSMSLQNPNTPAGTLTHPRKPTLSSSSTSPFLSFFLSLEIYSQQSKERFP